MSGKLDVAGSSRTDVIMMTSRATIGAADSYATQTCGRLADAVRGFARRKISGKFPGSDDRVQLRGYAFIVIGERSQSGTMMLGCVGYYIHNRATVAQVAQLIDREERRPGKVGLHAENAIELDGMSNRFVDLQAKLRGAEDHGELSFGTLRRLVQRHRFFAGAFGVLDQAQLVDQFVAFVLILAAEGVRI